MQVQYGVWYSKVPGGTRAVATLEGRGLTVFYFYLLYFASGPLKVAHAPVRTCTRVGFLMDGLCRLYFSRPMHLER